MPVRDSGAALATQPPICEAIYQDTEEARTSSVSRHSRAEVKSRTRQSWGRWALIVQSTLSFNDRVRAYYNSPTAKRMAQERAKRFGSRNKTISPEGLEAAIRRFESLGQSKRPSLMRELFEMGRLNGFKVRGL